MCYVALPDILLLFYLYIYLLIDEEAGHGLSVGCTAFKRHIAEYLALFDYKYCHFVFKR